MDLNTQTEVLERINAYLDSGSDPMAPSSKLQQSTHYVSAERLDQEQTSIFAVAAECAMLTSIRRHILLDNSNLSGLVACSVIDNARYMAPD